MAKKPKIESTPGTPRPIPDNERRFTGTVLPSQYQHYAHPNGGTLWFSPTISTPLEQRAFQQLETWRESGYVVELTANGVGWRVALRRYEIDSVKPLFGFSTSNHPTPLAAIQSAMEVVK